MRPASLAAIDIVLFGFWMAIGGNDNLAAALKKVLHLVKVEEKKS